MNDCCSKANKDIGLRLSQIKAQAVKGKTFLQFSRLFNKLDKPETLPHNQTRERFSLSVFQQVPVPLVKISRKQLKDMVHK